MSYFQILASAVQGGAQVMQGYGEAKTMDRQAEQMDDAARVTRQQGGANEETMRRNAKMQLGNLRAAAAESGFDASSGSLAEIQARSAGEAELDILTERYKSELQAIGQQNEARSLRTSAQNTRRGALLSAFGTMGSGAARSYAGSKMPVGG